MDEEWLDVVDINDKVIGKDLKQNKLSKKFISRNVVIFIRDSNNKYIICKRAAHKKTFPNCLDASACGNVRSGESYHDAAKRELEEELGIKCNLQYLKKKFTDMEHENESLQFHTSIFLGEYEGEIKLNEELSHFHKYSYNELTIKIKNNPTDFVPTLIKDIEHIKEHLI